MLVAVGTALIVLVGGGGLGYLGYRDGRAEASRLQQRVSADLHAGQADLEAAKDFLKQATSTYDSKLIDRGRARLASARGHFLDARYDVDSSWMIRDGRLVPILSAYIAPRQAAVDGLADMGVALCDATVSVADLDQLLVKPDGGGSGAAKLLGVLQQAGPALNRIHDEFVKARTAIAQVRPDVLSPDQRAQLAGARSTVDSGLQGIDDFRTLVPGLVELLGGNQARSYLFLPQNSTELRSGGGFIGTYGVIRVDHGQISLEGEIHELDSPQSPHFDPPSWLIGFESGRTWKLEDSNVFPNFDANAKWAEYFASQVYHVKVDGVIGMDTTAVQALIGVTGPIAVPEYGVTVGTDNFDREVLQRSVFRDPSHKDILAAISKPLIEKIRDLPATSWPKLIQVMNDQVGRRHLQLLFHNQDAQRQLANFGWSPLMQPRPVRDYMFEVECNMGGAKSNYFLTRSFDVTLSHNGNLLHHLVVVTIDNTPPRPARASSNFLNQYIAYMQMYVGKNATGLRLSSPTVTPPDYPNHDIPAGFLLKDGWLNAHNYSLGIYTATWEWDTPWLPNGQGEHEIYWQKQPGTGSDRISITWKDGTSTFKTTGTLDQDQVVRLGPRGVLLGPGQLAAAHLPGLSPS